MFKISLCPEVTVNKVLLSEGSSGAAAELHLLHPRGRWVSYTVIHGVCRTGSWTRWSLWSWCLPTQLILWSWDAVITDWYIMEEERQGQSFFFFFWGLKVHMMYMWVMKFRPRADCRHPLCAAPTGCPWRLCRLYPCRYSKGNWTMPWATWHDLGADPAVWGRLDQKPSEMPSSPDCTMVLCSDQQQIAVQLSSVAQSPACGSTRCWRTLCSHSQRGSPVVPWHTALAMGPLGVWSTSAVQCKFQLKYSLFLTVNGWCWHSAERGELDLSMTWKNL